jgi:eukaryotic-like serine/threonine-protein kinase
MVIERLAGRVLRRILDKEKGFRKERERHIALEVCNTLVHKAGIIHPDLKPQNVMVGGKGRIPLIDFGFAGEVAGRRLTFARITKSTGTPDYISPE